MLLARSGARRSFFVERLSVAAADHYERAVVAQRYPQRIILVRHGAPRAKRARAARARESARTSSLVARSLSLRARARPRRARASR